MEKIKIHKVANNGGRDWEVTFPEEFPVGYAGSWSAWDLKDAQKIAKRVSRKVLGPPCDEGCATQTFCQDRKNGHIMCGYCNEHRQPIHHCKSECWGI